MRNVVTKSIKRLVQLRDIVSTALTAGNNGKSLAMTWDDSAQTLTLTKDPAFDSATINNTTASTSSTTGALVVGNSVGIGGGNINASGAITCGDSEAITPQVSVLGGRLGRPIFEVRRTSGATAAYAFALSGGGFTILDSINNRISLNVFSFGTKNELYIGTRSIPSASEPVDSILQAESAGSNGSADRNSGTFYINGSCGTGAGSSGAIVFQTSNAGPSGSTTEQTKSERLRINETQILATHPVASTVGFSGPYLRPATNSTTALRIQNADGSTTLQNFDTTNNRVGHPVFSSFTAGAQFGSDAPDFGGGAGAIIGIDNAATVPTTNPTNGVVVYAEGGAFRVRDASGNIGEVVHDGAQSFAGAKTFTDNPAISKSAGVAGQLNFATNGILRWQIEKTAAAETGGNAGSNLIVNRYDDGGGYTGTFLQLFRDTGKLEIYAETEFTGALRIPQGTPASASSPGARGQIVHDADYIYICVAANTWKRTALTTW